jgi:hypothetical protein
MVQYLDIGGTGGRCTAEVSQSASAGPCRYDPGRIVKHLEKRYFEVGNLGFLVIRAPMDGVAGINIGMMIRDDRRWPEASRVLGLQSAELVALVGFRLGR